MKAICLFSPAAARFARGLGRLRNGLLGSLVNSVDAPLSPWLALCIAKPLGHHHFQHAQVHLSGSLPYSQREKGELLAVHVIVNHVQPWSVPPPRGLGDWGP